MATPPAQHIGAQGFDSSQFGDATAWQVQSLAPAWFEDAVEQSRLDGVAARRREIAFSVAAAECFLFEVVRDRLMGSDRALLEELFPVGNYSNVREKWKNVAARLFERGVATRRHEFGDAAWSSFHRLVDFRNGLMHARASRPVTGDTPENAKPMPSPEEMQTLEPGWPSATAAKLIQEFSITLGVAKPEWASAGP